MVAAKKPPNRSLSLPKARRLRGNGFRLHSQDSKKGRVGTGFYCYLWLRLYMHLQLPAHGVVIGPIRRYLSILRANPAIAPVFSRAINTFCHLHKELGCLPRMSVRVRLRCPVDSYRFCKPSSSGGLEPAQMATHGCSTQHGVWILFKLSERDCFFGGDLRCTIRIYTRPFVHIPHCDYSPGHPQH